MDVHDAVRVDDIHCIYRRALPDMEACKRSHDQQEVKDERKNTDGSPEVKSRIRRLQQEIQRRMMSDAPDADGGCQSTAVALKYDVAKAKPPLWWPKASMNWYLHLEKLFSNSVLWCLLDLPCYLLHHKCEARNS